MLGRIVITAKEETGLTRETVGKMPILTARISLDGWKVKGHIRRVARKMRGLGVRKVVAPEDFPHWDILDRAGLCPVDTTEFLQRLAPKIALTALQQRGILPQQATVAIRGGRTNAAMHQGAQALCSMVRHLVVDVPQRGAQLAEGLQREYGLPFLASDTPAHLALRYSGHPEPGELSLRHPWDEKYGLAVETEAEWVPPECKTLEMMTLLWETGNLPLETVQVFNRATLDRKK